MLPELACFECVSQADGSIGVWPMSTRQLVGPIGLNYRGASNLTGGSPGITRKPAPPEWAYASPR